MKLVMKLALNIRREKGLKTDRYSLSLCLERWIHFIPPLNLFGVLFLRIWNFNPFIANGWHYLFLFLGIPSSCYEGAQEATKRHLRRRIVVSADGLASLYHAREGAILEMDPGVLAIKPLSCHPVE